MCVPNVPLDIFTIDEDDLPLTQLLKIAKDRNLCGDLISDPQDYASIDNDLASTDNIQDGWEDRLMDDLLEPRSADDTDDASTTDPDPAIAEIDPAVTPAMPAATFKDALDWSAKLKQFCQDSCPELWQSMCHIEEKLQTKALLNASTNRQLTLDSFFST
jgi:hypothetical protein